MAIERKQIIQGQEQLLRSHVDIRLDHISEIKEAIERSQPIERTPNSPLKVFEQIKEIGSQSCLVKFSGSVNSMQRSMLEGVRRDSSNMHTARIMDALKEAASASERTCIKLNEAGEEDTYWDEVASLFADPNQELKDNFEAGKIEGINTVLGQLSGETPLAVDMLRVLSASGFSLPDQRGGSIYQFPTCLKGVDVNYSYLPQSSIPDIQILVHPLD